MYNIHLYIHTVHDMSGFHTGFFPGGGERLYGCGGCGACEACPSWGGGLGACPPRKILKIRCSEMDSGGFLAASRL